MPTKDTSKSDPKGAAGGSEKQPTVASAPGGQRVRFGAKKGTVRGRADDLRNDILELREDAYREGDRDLADLLKALEREFVSRPLL